MTTHWKFQTDPDKMGLKEGVINKDYDDHSWKRISVTKHWQDQGYPNYYGTTWYRRNMNITANLKGKVLLFFGAVDGDAVVYLNGKKVGEHLLKDGLGWDEPFAVDVTDVIKKGDNTIAVQVTKDAYVGGIYKGIALLTN